MFLYISVTFSLAKLLWYYVLISDSVSLSYLVHSQYSLSFSHASLYVQLVTTIRRLVSVVEGYDVILCILSVWIYLGFRVTGILPAGMLPAGIFSTRIDTVILVSNVYQDTTARRVSCRLRNHPHYMCL